MTNQHPITPPPELVQQWFDEARDTSLLTHKIEQLVAVRAAQWGADQELEACCEWLDKEGWSGESRQLRADRRPKPPSLKDEAMNALAWVDKHLDMPFLNHCDAIHTIRHALESLND